MKKKYTITFEAYAPEAIDQIVNLKKLFDYVKKGEEGERNKKNQLLKILSDEQVQHTMLIAHAKIIYADVVEYISAKKVLENFKKAN